MSVDVEILRRSAGRIEGYGDVEGSSTHEIITDRASTARRGRVARGKSVWCCLLPTDLSHIAHIGLSYRPRSVSSCGKVSQRGYV
jgi:hypothetical protein